MAVVKNNTNTALNAPIVCRRRLVPAAGSHTFTVKAFAAGQTGSVAAPPAAPVCLCRARFGS